LSDSEFLPVWKKYPGVAGTMIKAEIPVKISLKKLFATMPHPLQTKGLRMRRLSLWAGKWQEEN
jgi:hypothetical protein